MANSTYVDENFISAPTKADGTGKWTDGDAYVTHRLQGYATQDYVGDSLNGYATQGYVGDNYLSAPDKKKGIWKLENGLTEKRMLHTG